MVAHSSGAGTSWNETLDVDQPHGLDYREWNDIRIGVRKRISQEHASFADSTVGGIHKPGGSAVLGIDYTDDCTAGVTADGTYRGHGLVWSYSKDTSNFGVLFCNTKVAGATTTGDWTVLKMHPDLQWSGGDVTWAGAHEFDASVDISGNVAIDGDLSVDGTANFGDDVAFVADVSVDGTTVFQDAVLTGDSTLTFDAIAGETGPTVKMFGDWSARAPDVTYTARTDGFVTARLTRTGTGLIFDGHTPHGTVVTGVFVLGTQSVSRNAGGSFPVKAGDTWAVVGDPTTYSSSLVYWLPLGDNT